MQTTFCPYCLRAVQGDVCPHCGKDVNYPGDPTQLPVGYTLTGSRPYILGAAIGQGGFGITYIALDTHTNSRVAVKEYFPTHCSARDNVTAVRAYPGQEEVFRKGREQFLLEAQTLHSLSDLSGIVNVQDYFEANDTAYLVMEFLEGCSLKDYVQQNGKFPAQQFLKQFRPLMEDIEAMHRRGVIHRDIAPDNIMLLPDGGMKLIDFGAARSYLGDKSMTVVVKKGFAPVEQYMRKGSGAFTDVYALAATIYYCITGQVPLDSVERQYGEETMPEPGVYGAELTDRQVEALSRALEIQPKARTQSVAQLMEGLFATAVYRPALQNSAKFQAAQRKTPPSKSAAPAAQPISAEKGREKKQNMRQTVSTKPRKTGKWLGLGIAACLLFAVGIAGGLLRGDETPSEPVQQVQAETPSEPVQQAQTETPVPDTQQETAAGWRDNVLMSLDITGPHDEFLRTGYWRSDIYAVTFWDHLDGVPEKYWDVSENQDGSVLAWAETYDGTEYETTGFDNVHIHIAANGGVNGSLACYYLFGGCENLTSITFNDAFYTNDATDMGFMFYKCKALTSLDLRQFDTSSVTDMSKMFFECKALTSLDLRHFDTSSVTDMSWMFGGCSALKEVELTGINTANVTHMISMFQDNHSLVRVGGIEDWDTSALINVSFMFLGCESLPDLTLNWDIGLLKTKGLAGRNTWFLNEGKKINGRPWEEFFR